MKLVYIHGHGASRDSFNFLRSELGAESIDLEYDSNNGFASNLGPMINSLEDQGDIFFVAHSLGGLYALHLADILKERCLGAVTMGTPYGGCESALWLNYLNSQRLYKDVHLVADPVTRGRNIVLHDECKWTCLIPTKGHSKLMWSANDGFVTHDSMRNRQGAEFIEVASNHHEIVQSPDALEIIKAALAEVEEMAVAA